jgi:hypothetical protein
VLRVVCRWDLSATMVCELLRDLKVCVTCSCCVCPRALRRECNARPRWCCWHMLMVAALAPTTPPPHKTHTHTPAARCSGTGPFAHAGGHRVAECALDL